jgi:flagellar transcriptional activator FlhD
VRRIARIAGLGVPKGRRGGDSLYEFALQRPPKKLDSSDRDGLMEAGISGLQNSFHRRGKDPDHRQHRNDRTGAHEMNADQILSEIREANLSYLMLAQSLIRTDREQALYRLGISEESAALIGLLTPAQMMKIAAGNTLLCRFRMDDDMVWGLLTNHGKSAANDSTSRLHASILMAGRHQEAA